MDTDGFQKLGARTFYFFLLERMAPAFLLVIAESFLLIFKNTAGGSLVTGMFPGQDAFTTSVFNFALVLIPILFIVVFMISFVIALLMYFTTRYKIDQNGFFMEKGIINKSEISLPFKQIQNVDVDETLLFRIFSMSNLIILTAGHEDVPYTHENQSEVVLPALPVARARVIQKYLLERANVQEVIPAPADVKSVVDFK